MSELELGPLGLVLNVADDRAHIEQAAEAERLGFSTLWLPGGQLETLEPLVELLRATEKVAVAPGIIPLDVHGTEDVVRLLGLLDDAEAARFVAGFGASQREARPLAGLRAFLDELDTTGVPVPAGPCPRRTLKPQPNLRSSGWSEDADAPTQRFGPEPCEVRAESLGRGVRPVTQKSKSSPRRDSLRFFL
jgi:hypothetical protein